MRSRYLSGYLRAGGLMSINTSYRKISRSLDPRRVKTLISYSAVGSVAVLRRLPYIKILFVLKIAKSLYFVSANALVWTKDLGFSDYNKLGISTSQYRLVHNNLHEDHLHRGYVPVFHHHLPHHYHLHHHSDITWQLSSHMIARLAVKLSQVTCGCFTKTSHGIYWFSEFTSLDLDILLIIRFLQFDGQPSDKKVVNTLKSTGYIFAYHKFGDISMLKKAT